MKYQATTTGTPRRIPSSRGPLAVVAAGRVADRIQKGEQALKAEVLVNDQAVESQSEPSRRLERSASTVIALDHVHKIYKMGDVEIHALRGVSLQIDRGEFVAIMGASGSGKSTMMNIVGCLDRPSKGRYFLEGQDVSGLSKDDRADIRNRKIGFVFQGFNLLARTSALENVELPMLYLGVKHAERIRRAREALELVGLGQRLNNMPNQLSGGQQQRVAIARALVNEPSIILADEPTGNLDSRTSIEVMDVFQYLNQERAITIALVTHEPDIAQYAGRVVVFKDGRVRRDYAVENRRSARLELESLPPTLDDDEEDDE